MRWVVRSGARASAAALALFLSQSVACNGVLGINLPDDGGSDAAPGSGADSGVLGEGGGPSGDGGGVGRADGGPGDPRDTGAPMTDAPSGDDGPGLTDAPVADAPGDDAGDGATCASNVDVMSDPGNCGRCGHDCAGSSCLAGQCRPFVVQGSQDYTSALAVDSSGIYWASEAYAEVFACPITGCAAPPTVLTSTQGTPLAIGLSASTVFWEADQGTGASIFTNPKSKLGPTGAPFVTRSTPIRSLTVDEADVFWTEYTSTSGYATYRCPVAGPCDAPSPVFADPVYAMASDGTNLVWASSESSLKMCTKASCVQQVLVDAKFARAQNVALHAGVAYVSDTGGASATTGSITACPVHSASCAPGNFASGLTFPAAIAADDSGVYWVGPESADAGDTSGAVFMCPLAGCPASGPIVVAGGQAGGVGYLALQGELVYFTSGVGAPYLMAVAKP